MPVKVNDVLSTQIPTSIEIQLLVDTVALSLFAVKLHKKILTLLSFFPLRYAVGNADVHSTDIDTYHKHLYDPGECVVLCIINLCMIQVA